MSGGLIDVGLMMRELNVGRRHDQTLLGRDRPQDLLSNEKTGGALEAKSRSWRCSSLQNERGQ